MTQPRRAFILLSSHALAYARICIRTLLNNSDEPVHLRLVVDNADEARVFETEVQSIKLPEGSRIEVITKDLVSDLLAQRYPGKQGLRALHEGHPCWRKIIDPLVLSAPEDEIIVADPDLLFPNLYRFEQTPAEGVMMMRSRQKRCERPLTGA
jgi:hypothetical protein